jgi:hypothetical protein
MTLCQLFPVVVIAGTVVGGFVAHVSGGHWDDGAAIGFAIAWLPMLTLGLLVGFMQFWRPDQPPCRCGRKSYLFVQILKPDQHEAKTWEYEYACSCGRHYIATTSRFDLVTASGNREPYMSHSNWGRWHLRPTED